MAGGAVLHERTVPKIGKIFLERKLRGLSPISTFIYLRAIYIILYIYISLSVWLQQNKGGPILGIYKALTDV